MLFRRRKALVCRQAVQLMTDYLDGVLDPRDRQRLESHLATCPHCSRYLAQIRQLVAASGHVDPGDLAPQARDDLVDLYRRWLAG